MQEAIIQALSGLGIFLFGMMSLEQALKDISGVKFRTFIKNFTSNTPKAIITGAFTTALLQSSTVVTLMAISFVGAGLFTLSSAIGVIFGSNLGTTITSWIVVVLGFKVKISTFALPIAGFGGLYLLFFGKKPKHNAIGRILFGFGMLFLGLDFLKSATESMSSTFDLKHYADYNILYFVLVGFFITFIIQSSAAATVIILSSLFSGIITFEMAATAVVGTNIGTAATTAILGAMGGSSNKKRASLAHLLFNLATAIMALAILDFITMFIFDVVGIEDESLGLALFHTIFNVLGIVIFSPFIKYFAIWLNTLFKTKNKTITLFINEVKTNVPDAGFEALKKETIHFYDDVLRYMLGLFKIDSQLLMQEREKVKKVLKNKKIKTLDMEMLYNNIYKLEVMITSYALDLNSKTTDKSEIDNINHIQYAIRKVSYSSMLLRNIQKELNYFRNHENKFIQDTYLHIRKRVTQFSKNLHLMLEGDPQRLDKSDKVYHHIDIWNQKIKTNVAQYVEQNKLSSEDIISILDANQAITDVCSCLIEVSALMMSLENDDVCINDKYFVNKSINAR
ncbi:Sodium-dependent phosphate transporter [hydrothermal vent metagenome]|uniref:Sodium-dependent phosphate transporter n=1 Tax=hydrothermal vent metagenome TaxID=652676 RepID=A0A3B1E671_9ZZZZ